MNLHIVLLQISFLLIFTNMGTMSFIIPNKRECTTTWMNKLMKVGCNDMNLKEVPQHLTTSVRVLDISFNRLKRLKKISFERYSKLRYLILYENMIQTVEEGTFSHLSSLEEIDLSNNALTTVPLEIFQLPSLRNLYVDSNDLINLSSGLESLVTPIMAPLEYLNIADCSLRNIPNLGILPNLKHINASQNPLEIIEVDNFAYMCHLKSVDLTKNKIPKCSCQQIESYLLNLGVDTISRINCDPDELNESICPDVLNTTIHSDQFRKCSTVPLRPHVYSNWKFVAGCALCGAIVLILLIIFLQKRRKVKKDKTRSNSKGFLNVNNNERRNSPTKELINKEERET